MTINIDNNYVDGATVGSGGAAAEDDPIGWLDPGRGARTGGSCGSEAGPSTRTGRCSRSRSGSSSAAAPAPRTRSNTNSGRRSNSASTSPPSSPGGGRARLRHPGDDDQVGSAAGLRLRRQPRARRRPPDLLQDGPDPGRITLSNLRATHNGVRLRISSAWPAGTNCPGQLALRTESRCRSARQRAAAADEDRKTLARAPQLPADRQGSARVRHPAEPWRA